MSLFKSVKKYEVESKRSVEVKKELDAHVATYPKARAAYESGRPLVVKLTGELAAVRAAEGNNSPGYKKIEAELRTAVLKRDKPLVEYGNVKNDLELELSQLNRFFIAEELERWGDETKKVRDEKVDEELAKEKDEPGFFTFGGPHRQRTNAVAIKLFLEKSQERCNHLREMTHNSIEEIEAFIQEAETEMKEIDLTPQIIEMDSNAFQQHLYETNKEPGRMAAGFIPPIGPAVEIKNPGEQGTDFDSRFEKAKKLFGKGDTIKPKP